MHSVQYYKEMNLDQIIAYLKYGKQGPTYSSTTIGTPTITFMIRGLQKLRQNKIDIEKNMRNIKQNKSKKDIKKHPFEKDKTLQETYQQIFASQQNQIKQLKQQVEELKKSDILTEQKIKEIHRYYQLFFKGDIEVCKTLLKSSKQVYNIPFLEKLMEPLVQNFSIMKEVHEKLRKLCPSITTKFQQNKPLLFTESLQYITHIQKNQENLLQTLNNIYQPTKSLHKLVQGQTILEKCNWVAKQIAIKIEKRSDQLQKQIDSKQIKEKNINLQYMLNLYEIWFEKKQKLIEQILDKKQGGKITQDYDHPIKNLIVQPPIIHHSWRQYEQSKPIKTKQQKQKYRLKIQFEYGLKIRNNISVLLRAKFQEMTNKQISQSYPNNNKQLTQTFQDTVINSMFNILCEQLNLKDIVQIFALAGKSKSNKDENNSNTKHNETISQKNIKTPIIDQKSLIQNNSQYVSVLKQRIIFLQDEIQKISKMGPNTWIGNSMKDLRSQNEKLKNLNQQLTEQNKRIKQEKEQYQKQQFNVQKKNKSFGEKINWQKICNQKMSQLSAKDKQLKTKKQQLVKMNNRFQSTLEQKQKQIKSKTQTIEQIKVELNEAKQKYTKYLSQYKQVKNQVEAKNQTIKLLQKQKVKLQNDNESFIKEKYQKQQQWKRKIDIYEKNLLKSQKLKEKIIQQERQFLNKVIQKYKNSEYSSFIMEQDSIQQKRKIILTFIEKKIQNKTQTETTATRELKLKIEQHEKSIKILQKQNSQLKQAKITSSPTHIRGKNTIISDQKLQQYKQMSAMVEELKIKLSQSVQKQNQIKSNYEKQKEQILNKCNKIQEELKATKQKLKEDTQLEAKINNKKQQLERINAQYSNTMNQINKNNVYVAQLTYQKQKLQKQILNAEQVRKSLSEAQIKIKEINDQYSAKQQRLKQMQDRLSKVTEEIISEKQQKLSQIIHNLRLKTSELTAKHQQLEQFESKFKDNKEQLQNFAKTKVQKQKQLHKLQTDIKQIRNKLSSQQTQIQKLQKRRKAIQEFKITQKQEQIKQIKQQLKIKQQQLEKQEQNIMKKKETSSAIDKQITEKQSIKNTKINQLEEVQIKIKEQQDKFKEQQKKVIQLQQRKNKCSQDKILQYQTKLRQIQNAIQEKTSQLEQKNQQSRNKTEEQIFQKQTKIKALEDQINTKTKELEQKIDKDEEMDKNLLEKQQELLQKIESCQMFKKQISKMEINIKQKEITLQKLEDRQKKVSQTEIKEKQQLLQNFQKTKAQKTSEIQQLKFKLQLLNKQIEQKVKPIQEIISNQYKLLGEITMNIFMKNKEFEKIQKKIQQLKQELKQLEQKRKLFT